ncbi:LysM peptidoglycan-binding domain-containing protein [Hydrogenophaga aquatica]
MTTPSTAPQAVQPHARAHLRPTLPTLPALRALRAGLLGTVALACLAVAAQTTPNYPVTSGQRSTAQQVAEKGVPLSELAPNAPDAYTVKRGDTLWGISGIFLQRPWRWPELWGMNLQQIRNPHLIFPGQVLVLTKVGDRAYLSLGGAGAAGGVPTVKLSPRVRSESLADTAIAPIPLHVIDPFLTDSMLVDGPVHDRAPRIAATQENRVLLSRGDRAYARGQYGNGDNLQGVVLSMDKGQPRQFRVYREADPLKDPSTGELLGYEAQFVGKAELARPEELRQTAGADGKATQTIVPATIDIVLAKEEMRVGDRLLPEPQRDVPTYIPHKPGSPQNGQIVKVHGNAVQFAGQNQVVIINRGAKDGLERGHVLAILRDANVVPDTTDGARPNLHLPGERNGLMMVFRTFDSMSYALVLQIADGVKVGDRFVNP